MNRNLFSLFLFFLCCLGKISHAQISERIQLVHANSLDYDQRNLGRVKRLIGNVQFKQQHTILDCDSAYQYEETNRVEAFGNVHINHQDSIQLYGEKLSYEGETKKAKLEHNVRMVDKSMTLTTEMLDFDLRSNTGNYTTGGKIVSGNDVLTSIFGYYFSNTKESFFKNKVVLVNPEYTINCDTLKYNSLSKTAYFYGPTTIVSKNDRMYCEYGQYNTEKQIARFSKNAMLATPKNIVIADSMYYEKINDYGKAFRNVELYDTANKVTIYGDYAELIGKLKQTIVTKNAVAKQYLDKDSMYLFADTIYSYNTTPTQKAMVKAYRNAKIIKTDMQAVCDSLVYRKEDSTVTLYTNPIMWSGANQITSDTIILFLVDNKLDSFILLSNAFMISREGAKQFNQVKGKHMHGLFEKSKIKYMRVYGNGQSIYYAKEDSGYIGVNVINCSEMEFFFKQNKIDRCIFITNPDAVFYPLNELKPEELRLKGFKWQKERRPSDSIIRTRLHLKNISLKKTLSNVLFSQ